MLTVEDGTGLVNADAYVSIGEFTSFCLTRGYNIDEYDGSSIEASVRQATAWIDTYSRYKGVRLTAAQVLEFPRSGLIDWSNYEVTGVPGRVKLACSELAFKGLAEPLYTDQDRGGKIVSESVGPISTTYAADAPTGKVWQLAVNLLTPYVRDPKSVLGPLSTNTDRDPLFTLGMNDFPTVGPGFTSADAERDT